MKYTEAIKWVLNLVPDSTEEEAWKMYQTYRAYRDEGQSDHVSKQYAGLL